MAQSTDSKNLSRVNALELVQLVHKGFSAHQEGQLDKAAAAYAEVLRKSPKHFDALHLLGMIHYQTGQLNLAVDLMKQAVLADSGNTVVRNNLGNVLVEIKDFENALKHYDRAIEMEPDNADSHNNRAIALFKASRWDEAVAAYGKVIHLRLDDHNAYYNRGNAFAKLKKWHEAIVDYSSAITLRPNAPIFYFGRGKIYENLEEWSDAISDYNHAILYAPNFVEAYGSRSYVLARIRRFEEAIQDLDKAIALSPESKELYFCLGVVYGDLKRWDAAIKNFDKAISLDMKFAGAYNNRGNIFVQIRSLKKAVHDLDVALSIDPYFDFLLGFSIFVKMVVCLWDEWSDGIAQLISRITAQKRASNPFSVLAVLDDPALQMLMASVYVQAKHPASHVLGDFVLSAGYVAGRKIRIGYYSADFHEHATTYLMAQLLEAHDRSRFEIFAFSFGPDTHDLMRQRVQAACDHFEDVSSLTDRDIAQRSRALGIDIAVDLKGYTQDSRTGIFAEGAAPVQVNFLGYPGTMGVSYIHYIIADRVVIPEAQRQHYVEQVVYMPHSYQVNDSTRAIADRIFSRQELGLPEHSFVFACLNNNYKIQPPTFDIWMRLLKSVPGSVLWLLQDNEWAAENLRKEAHARGVDAQRLVFAQRMPLAEHLVRQKSADLFLDTWPCCAHTTASDALWVGLPLLTCMGQSFASRVAGSLLHALGLPELVTESPQAYEARALELATHPQLLKVLRDRLQEAKYTSPLFDGHMYARDLEKAFEQMNHRRMQGLQPEMIEVACSISYKT